MKSLSSFVTARGLAYLLGLLSTSAIITSCSSGGSGSMAGAGHGPFDSRGNYVEAWADNPEMWKGRSKSSPSIDAQPEPIMLAANDTPPATMTPVATAPSRPTKTVSTASIKPRTTTTSVSTKPRSTVAKTTTKPKSVASTKSRTSSSSRITVKKGDTLYGLAIRHKSSVSAIQKANGLRDSKLSIGRSLVIPRI